MYWYKESSQISRDTDITAQLHYYGYDENVVDKYAIKMSKQKQRIIYTLTILRFLTLRLTLT